MRVAGETHKFDLRSQDRGARAPKHAIPLVAVEGLAAACSRSSVQQAGPRALCSCRVGGIKYQTLCGTYEVFERKVAKQGRKIFLLVVVPALAVSPEPTRLVLLAGEFGQAATETKILKVVDRIQHNRDIVLVDQRGTGDAQALECKADPEEGGLSAKFDDAYREEGFRKCLASYNMDPRLYTTHTAMKNLDKARGALGYEKLNMWSDSYGTRVALVYLRQHLERVCTVVLEGFAPINLHLPLYMLRDEQRALDLLFEHCEGDENCGQAFSHLRKRVVVLLEQMAQAPVEMRIAPPLTACSRSSLSPGVCS